MRAWYTVSASAILLVVALASCADGVADPDATRLAHEDGYLQASPAVPNGTNPCDGPAGAHNPNCDEDGNFHPPGEGLEWPEPDEPITLPNLVEVHPPSAAEGVYGATGASAMPAPSAEGVTAGLAVVHATAGIPSEGCDPLTGFPPGAIAMVDRGSCTFVSKVRHAQDAGAVAVIVINSVAQLVTMDGSDPSIVIPVVMITNEHGTLIRENLPATATVRSNPDAE
jgi:hypothetical protein